MSSGYITKKGETKRVVATYLPEEIKEEFKQKCKQELCSTSEVLRRFVYIYLGKSE